nr:omega-amidase YafV-like [Nerophis lumbriciformis]XP_061806078.1 omega-amidase YafV-like [Nerophis lumbriciformis]
MQDLSVTLVQASTRWHAPDDNLDLYGELLSAIGQTDLIVLPEMFTTGFTMAAHEQAEPMNGPAMAWLAAQSAQRECVVTGTLVIEDEGRYFNRLVWMRPDGQFDSYDKRHLFRMANEHMHYAAGSERIIVELKGWRICPLVCYDLRFPIWSRNLPHESSLDYDLLLYLANWPAPRRNAWKTLMQARAIENLSYVVGVNRVGRDSNGLAYAGDSRAIDYKGEVLLDLADEPSWQTTVLDAEGLLDFRAKFPAHLDADAYSLDGLK